MEKILFGAGEVGRELLRNGTISPVAYFCDNKKSGEVIDGVEVISFEQLKKIHFNYEVIIAVRNRKVRQEIKELLANNKIGYRELDELDEVKYAGELGYWEDVYNRENHSFKNEFYKRLMLGIAEEKNDRFLSEKVVCDFGCGPRGSLTWMKSPAVKIGVDVLVPKYFEHFGETMINHEMIYVTSTEKYIPLPDEFVDCLLTINSLDHVRNLEIISSELNRILKKGGRLLASFNLFEPVTECEPQTLTEEIINEVLLKNFEIETYRIAERDEKETYKNLIDKNLLEKANKDCPCILWVSAVKKD
ncbi:class I SAM-dependent methyltransferase [Pseudobutyrivibrio xylanivorans]|uniref:Methyltransferase domain-containing protein n=1 Tax=Pseudobutyrivibrio xylanivorans DSM 14809 TaxID=1123012 RepID=A0A1M6D9Y3_PSEXY|nr:methyltransferase domain-containing protein [Pseudobutyrivibrio xylanivorans]SHI70053.1 Methyltransferase domain-containing protein [Pseudobutyrivibrio xylanivorans DSM 14809]